MVENIEEGWLLKTETNIAWVYIGFSYGVSYLIKGIGYELAIKRALMLGGDTDTNGAIIGGMIGATVGL